MDNNPSTSNLITTDSFPTTMLPGAVIRTILNGEPVVLVGTLPTGLTAILCPEGWRRLRAWKLIRLRTTQGKLYAAGTGRAAGFAAARFLLNASGNHDIRYRNANPFDIRLSNIVAIPHGLMKQAKIEAARGPDYKNPDVRWVDVNGGVHCHSGKPVTSPSAEERVAKLQHGSEWDLPG